MARPHHRYLGLIKEGFIVIPKLLGILWLPISAPAQDEKVTIVGNLSDGTQVLPAPKPELPELEIRETKVVQLPDRKVSIHRIADPGLPPPRPKLLEWEEMSAEDIEQVHKQAQQGKDQAAKTTYFFISATIVDNRATLLRWRHGETEYQAWSSSDWMLLTIVTECKKGDKHFVTHIMAGQLSSKNLLADSPYRIPENFSAVPGTYQITKGDLENYDAYEGITALHTLYRSDYTLLKQAVDLREQRRKERKAALRANPPEPEDIVLHYRKVQPKRRLGSTNGGAK